MPICGRDRSAPLFDPDLIFGRDNHEKAQVSHHHTHAMIELTTLSDAELSDRLQTTLEKLGIPVNAGDVIDLKALPNGEDGVKG